MSGAIENKGEFSASPSRIGELPARIYQATLGRLLRGGGRAAWDFSSFNLLPLEVLQEIDGNGSYLSREGILKTSDTTPAWQAPAFYLTVKALQNNRTAQKEALTQAVTAESQPGSYSTHLRSIVEQYNPQIIEKVQAAKLKQINRMTPEFWVGEFGRVTDALKNEHQGRQMFVLAYASLVGIEHFARLSRETGESLHLLIENWYTNPADNMAGYKINARDGVVEFLPKDFQRKDDFVIADDAVHSWATFKRSWGYITGEDPKKVTIDPTRTLYVDKITNDGTALPGVMH